MSRALACLMLCGLAFAGLPAWAADLYRSDNWSAMASDRNAYQTGDILTVIVYENASAIDTASSSSSNAIRCSGCSNFWLASQPRCALVHVFFFSG